MSRPAPIHYVDNKRLYEELVKRRPIYLKCKAEGKPPPPANDYIGRALMLICERLGTKRSFSGYSYRDEMVDDAIENCALVIDSFDPEKSNNPFGYFSLVARRAFFRRLEKEKTEQYVRFKKTELAHVSGELSDSQEGDDSGAGIVSEFLNNDANIAFVRGFEAKLAEKRKKPSKKSTVMEFVG